MVEIISGGIANRPSVRKQGGRTSADVRDHIPARARLNIIPSPDALDDLIDRALAALSKGFYWDRGSIINIVL